MRTRTSGLRGWVTAGLAVAVAAALTAQVVGGFGIVHVDVQLRDWLARHQVAWAVSIAQGVVAVISPPVDALALGGVALALVQRRRDWRAALVPVAALAGTAAVVLGMKYGIGRPPANPASCCSARGAFPSGHTASALVFGAAAIVATRARPRWWWALTGAASVLVLCLLYTRDHWLSDVLASVALAVAAAPGLRGLDARLQRMSQTGRMSVVKINVLTVPQEMRETLEHRFAGRAGAVESSDGFEWFELLRPVEGTDRYLVYTRWRSESDFQAWMSSQSFSDGHAQASGRHDGSGPAASDSAVWSFEVVQQAAPKRP